MSAAGCVRHGTPCLTGDPASPAGPYWPSGPIRTQHRPRRPVYRAPGQADRARNHPVRCYDPTRIQMDTQ